MSRGEKSKPRTRAAAAGGEPPNEQPSRCLACGRDITNAQASLRISGVTVHVERAVYRVRRFRG